MTKSDNPRLCGGTFFTLILEALRQRIKAREHYKGESDGLNDPDVLIGLLKVVNPEYETPQASLNSMANSYKSCKISNSAYLPFNDQAVMGAFDRRVKERYQEALEPMTEFVLNFLEVRTENEKDVDLVKALIDLVQQDSSIADDEGFFIGEQGEEIQKAAFGDIRKVCLPAFLLGIWHYAVTKRKNNVGQKTYDKWCPENGGAIREYCGKMGKTLSQQITIFMPASSQNKSTAADGKITDDAEDDNHFDDSNSQEEASNRTQIINNPFVIQQNGNDNTVIPNYGTINIIKH